MEYFRLEHHTLIIAIVISYFTLSVVDVQPVYYLKSNYIIQMNRAM